MDNSELNDFLNQIESFSGNINFYLNALICATDDNRFRFCAINFNSSLSDFLFDLLKDLSKEDLSKEVLSNNE